MSDSLIHAAAGSAAGIVAMTATYPLIFLSTRSAVEVKKESKSTAQAVKDIIKREGFTGLYSGLSSSLLAIGVTNGVYYYFYERARGAILRSRVGGKGLSTFESILAGLIAGSATTLISNPIWVVQTSQATQSMEETPAGQPQRKRKGIFATISHILATDGPKALLRGLGPALVLVMNPVIQYTVFEQLKNLVVRRRTHRLRETLGAGATVIAALSDWDFFWLGALAKLAATGSTYPYIVVKSRLQSGHEHAKRYKGALDGILTIIREEGIEGLYKGIGNKLTQSVLTAAILFASQRRIYEITKAALAKATA
ncbi:mitochondrial carrier [Cylindrobasidium torrendii FP15055 ss-10]|uniref:Mitochondrial carrier n=1 Tax=Cylindrobasidium torrendii FP15055 ss-10 TaxID=1314674 RepID=A0A0D7BMS3_9AGAR|nr:mitochondrial carrier [Cylindrobasidium torrendii FP15055 ss-10]